MSDLTTQIEQVRTLVETYKTHYDQYTRATYNETEVRVDFVNPLFKALGWDILNERGLPQHLREVKHEANVIVEESGQNRKKRPDYSFRAGTEQCFFLETKKPSVDIRTAVEPAFQLRRYGWSGNLPVSILTNFTDLVIYDCSIRPLENDPAKQAVVAHYHYTEYANKFEEIFSLISKEAVATGAFSNTFSNIESPLVKEPFDDYFLNQIKQWRNILSQDVVNNNDNIDSEALNILVQKILNRIVFLRICEDRSFEQYETLKGITTYAQLKESFVIADNKCDSGLFDLIDEQELNVSDNIIVNIFRDLYYPNSSYEFSVVDPFIIGQIYESFLTEAITIMQDKTIASIQKPEAVDSQGAVNTPKNIADFIVKETLSHLYDADENDKVSAYCIADICCGSGNFLIAAFEYIVNYFIEHLRKTSLEESLRRGDLLAALDGQTFELSFERKRKVLISNIYGVDIDPLAVEVAKLSLLLKLLENVSADELNAYITASGQKALPNLDENIKCGNSLIDSRYADYNPDILANAHLLNQINMFDWENEFNHIKFDAIIGNPPYIRVQNMVRYSPEEYQYYKTGRVAGYETSESELLDKYYLFIERGLSLLTESGVLGYIIPHRFMNTGTGRILREWLSSRMAVKKITHFGTHQVFANKSTYTCVVIFSATAQESFDIGFVRNWNRFLFEHTTVYDNYPANVLDKTPWTFIPVSIRESLCEVAPRCSRLDELTEIFVGLQTSADPIYIVCPSEEDDTYIYFTDKDGHPRTIEKSILKKSIYDCKIRKYEPISHNSYIIFPYHLRDGKLALYSIDEMEAEYPLAYDYLNQYKDELSKRKMERRHEDRWFAYGRSQSLRRFFGGERLVWPVLSIGSNYVFDSEAIAFTGGGNGPYYGLQMRADIKESIFYIQAVLNYWLSEYLVKRSASTFRGDYYSHGKQFIATLPIYRIDFNDTDEAKKHEDVVASVERMMNLSIQKNSARTQQQKETLDRAIIATTRQIESILNSLYGLSENERVDI